MESDLAIGKDNLAIFASRRNRFRRPKNPAGAIENAVFAAGSLPQVSNLG
jgi:hypothetical protein